MDVFVYDDVFEEPCLQLPNYEIATIFHIIRAKKSYVRMKDWLQLRKISQLFFKQEEFEKFLDEPTIISPAKEEVIEKKKPKKINLKDEEEDY